MKKALALAVIVALEACGGGSETGPSAVPSAIPTPTPEGRIVAGIGTAVLTETNGSPLSRGRYYACGQVAMSQPYTIMDGPMYARNYDWRILDNDDGATRGRITGDFNSELIQPQARALSWTHSTCLTFGGIAPTVEGITNFATATGKVQSIQMKIAVTRK